MLAGKRERPAEAKEEEKPAPCEEFLCKLLGEIISWGIVVALVMAVVCEVNQPTAGQPSAVQSPIEYAESIGAVGPANPTRGIFTGFRELQFRFEFIKLANHKAKQKIDEEVLASFKADLDRLGEFLAKAQPGDRLSHKNRVVVAKEFEELQERLDGIEKSLVLD